jgi:hypothetical protein
VRFQRIYRNLTKDEISEVSEMKINKKHIFCNAHTQHKTNQLLELAKTGEYSAPRLAKLFNCDRKTIFRALDKYSIHLKNLGKFKRKYTVNDDFFNELNTVSAYWLGFIAADGTLSSRDNSFRIGLNKSDDTHLKKFLNAISSNNKIYYVQSNHSASIEIYSVKLINSLLSYGITPKKSLTINYVKVPQELMSHFIRGVYDGDGSLTGKRRTHVQLMIAGNKPFLEQIQNVLIKECNLNKVKIYPLPSKAFKLQYTGIQVFRILEFMYKDSDPHIRLDRKYGNYISFKERFQ